MKGDLETYEINLSYYDGPTRTRKTKLNAHQLTLAAARQ